MSNAPQSYILNLEERDRIEEELKTLYKERVLLQQSVREQQTQAASATEDLCLELLEVGDALEALLDYLTNNPNPSAEFLQRLPRSMGAVHRKFLSVLAKRQVLPIELVGTQSDFDLCRLVEREVRADLPDQTITKVLRQGFHLGNKVLRPTEVITSKSNVTG